MLGGKCRSCKIGISVQYPIIELLTGILFTGVTWYFGTGLTDGGTAMIYAAATCIFLWFLIFNLMVLLITDWRESVIFILNSLSLVPAGIVFNLLGLGIFQGDTPIQLGSLAFSLPTGIVESLLGILSAIAVFEGLILLSKVAFGTEGFGHGDTHMMMGVGAFLGWKLCLLAIVLGFIVQMIPAIPLMIYQWIKQKQWTPLVSGSLSAVFAVLPVLFPVIPIFSQNLILYTVLTLVCLVLSIVALIFFMKAVRQSESFTYLPLGPALVISSLICLFWGSQILQRLFG
jgi:leader peptidase (prepilin peptidase)/N-methyltransferase